MSELFKAIDDQMLRWVAELDELKKREADFDEAIQQLEQRIDITRQSLEFLKEAVRAS